ncbi:MAG: serine/threonine protein kinase [Deltaproteobacteria bacterium]|nr:serine/threonine protein kinase [Deltaproteobacteria bacterium]MBN2670019.1 serine/threonine protein kinase [Deltaproteobacteria bacterium]
MQMTRRLGGYHILATIGHGGMGDVYLAMKDGPGGFGKLLVLKVLQHKLIEDPEFLAMFLDEGRIAARLNHPNVVQTFETGRDDDVHYIVMEYLDGVTLGRLMQEELRNPGPNTPRLFLSILAQALSGLHHAHELTDFDGLPLHIVHRDATPQNIFITYDGAVKMVDFGIAKALDSKADTQAGVFKGKLGYLPPEQFTSGVVDRRADVFSLGVVLWEAIVGRRMYRGKSEIEIMNALTTGNFPNEDSLPGTVPDALKWIVSRATAAAVEQRYATAQEFQDEIEDYLQEIGGSLSTRELAEIVRRRFAEQRTRIGRCIEQQLRLYNDFQHGLLAGKTPTEWNMIPRLDVPQQLVGSLVVDSSSQGGFSESSFSEEATVDCKLPTGIRPSTTPVKRKFKQYTVMIAAAAALMLVGAMWYVKNSAVKFGDLATRLGLSERIGDAENTAVQTTADASEEIDARRRGSGKYPVVLSGDIEEDTVLTNDRIYLLKNTVYVHAGASLMIQAGTVIQGDKASAGTLIVQPGARIIAQGTAEHPIVFTSAEKEGGRASGDWGGIIVLGFAPVNNSHNAEQTAVLDGISFGAEYGGDNPDDDSGILEYVRIEYAGRELAPNARTNGLTFGGVGRFTKVNHIQVRHVREDCFAFFGGTVDAKYLICQSPGDDGFDWNYGYVGRLQFILLAGGDDTADGANGLEGGNDLRGIGTAPISAPTIYNATLCGQNDPKVREHYGVLVRRGTQGVVGNSIFTGFAAGYDVRNEHTSVKIIASTFYENLQHIIAYPESNDRRGAYKNDDSDFNEYRYVMQRYLKNSTADPGIAGCIRRTARMYKPEIPVAGGMVPPNDGFFDTTATYRGAFRNETDDWDKGIWVQWM